MNKVKLLKDYLDLLNEKKSKIDLNIKLALKDTHEAESAMQSRYDTKREEAEAMVEWYSIQSSKILEVINSVKKILFRIENEKSVSNKVLLGSIVKYIDYDEDSEKAFFIVPWWDFEKKWDLYYLWINTPLWKQLIWKEAGEEYEIELPNEKKEIEILSII